MHPNGNHRTLSSGLVAEVAHCVGCGLIHLNIGALTLRLQPAALHDLRDTLDRAVAAPPSLHEPLQKTPSPCH